MSMRSHARALCLFVLYTSYRAVRSVVPHPRLVAGQLGSSVRLWDGKDPPRAVIRILSRFHANVGMVQFQLQEAELLGGSRWSIPVDIVAYHGLSRHQQV